jgi:beta-lactamase regulating signal transducer with metallopeptidase domain
MSDFAMDSVIVLARTTLWLTLTGLATAALVRLARANSPAVHRFACVLTLAVGWAFLRYPVAVPWYDAEPAVDVASRLEAPQVEPVEISALPASEEPLAVELAPEVEPPLAAAPIFASDLPAAAATGPIVELPLAPTGAVAVAALPVAELPADTPQPVGWAASAAILALAIWTAGIVLLPAAWLVGYWRFVRTLASRRGALEAWHSQWSELLATSGVRQSIPLQVTDEAGPMLCRLPGGYALLVPEALWRELDHEQRLAILRHELAHYVRGDVWKSLAVRVLALPHWFNPVSWAAVRRFDEAAEWACDSAATDEEPATRYARTLVRLGEMAVGPVPYGSAMRGRPLAARVRRVLSGRCQVDSRMKQGLLLAAALTLVALSTVQLQLVAKQPVREEAAEQANAQDIATTEQAAEIGDGDSAEPPLKRIHDELVKYRAEIEKAIEVNRLEIMALEARRDNPDGKPPSDEVVEAELNKDLVISRTTDELSVLNGLLDDLSDESPTSPTVKKLSAQIRSFKERIEERKNHLRPLIVETLSTSHLADKDHASDGPRLAVLKQRRAALEAEYIKVDNLARHMADELAHNKEATDAAADEQEEVDEPTAKQRAIAIASQKMVVQARRAFDANLAAFTAETAPLEAVYGWSLRWMTAAQSAAGIPPQKVAAARAHLDRMRSLQKKIHLLYVVGTRGGEAKEEAAANFYVAEAERYLAQAEASAQSAKATTAPRQSDRYVLKEDTASNPFGAGTKWREGEAPRELQRLDLQLKIAELEGQLEQAESRFPVLLAANNAKKGSVNQGEITGLLTQINTLKKQLKLLNEKLKVFDSLSAAALPPTTAAPVSPPLLVSRAAAPPQIVPAPTHIPGPLVAAPVEPPAKRPLVYGGKDFDAWAAELRSDLDPKRRKQAIDALATFGAHGMGQQAAATIIETTREYFGPKAGQFADTQLLRDSAVYALRKVPVQETLPHVTKLLKSEIPPERLFGVNVVSGMNISLQDRETLLSELVDDPEPDVARSATEAMLVLNPAAPSLVNRLREMLASPDQDTAYYAFAAVINHTRRRQPNTMDESDRQLLTALMPDLLAVADRDEPTKSAAQRVLKSLDREAIPSLEEALNSSNPSVRERADALIKVIEIKHGKYRK